jgi:hypothetical protein
MQLVVRAVTVSIPMLQVVLQVQRIQVQAAWVLSTVLVVLVVQVS